TISPLIDPSRPARTREEKAPILEAARTRLMAGDYPLAADAYISFWTCGRTRTLREAVGGLEVQLPTDDTERILRDDANGLEESLGVNVIRLSNVALRATNPIECTMGRIIDMAFHHAVKLNVGLNADLLVAPPPRTTPPVVDTTPRHLAGLHLIS